MIWNPFRKKKENAPTNTPETIEQRIEREINALPQVFQGKLKDPTIKKRFIDIAKRMEQDGVDFKSIRQMKKWMKTPEAELRAQGTEG